MRSHSPTREKKLINTLSSLLNFNSGRDQHPSGHYDNLHNSLLNTLFHVGYKVIKFGVNSLIQFEILIPCNYGKKAKLLLIIANSKEY